MEFDPNETFDSYDSAGNPVNPTHGTGEESAEPEFASGLSIADIEQLEGRHRRLVDALICTPAGRAVVKRTDPQIDQIGDALMEDLDALGKIAQKSEAEDGDYLRRKSAAIVLNELMVRCHQLATYDLYAHRSKLYSKAQNVHKWMDSRIRSRRTRSNPSTRLLAKHWGWSSNLFTILAASALLRGWFPVAAALIGGRILMTTLVWSLAAYPSDDSPNKPVLDSDPRICVLGHGGDLFLFASFGIGLVQDAHLAAGFLVIAAGSIMLLGSLMRLGASASGFPVPRLHLERMVRGGSTFAAIYLAATPSVQWWWSAVVIILLPTLFAGIETQEAFRAFKLGKDTNYRPIAPGSSQIQDSSPTGLVSS